MGSINVVEVCHVSPSKGAPNEQLLHLQNFDILRLRSNFMELLFFYRFECTEQHFLENISPRLKRSLSLTLKHFLPLAGKIVFPLASGMPASRYVAGDSIPLTIAVSKSDFNGLMGNHSKDADQFRRLMPQLPAPNSCPDYITIPVLAIQATLFPNNGIAIGYTIHHAIADGDTILRFLQAWSSTNKFNGDEHLVALGEKFLPLYGRSFRGEANSLAATAWNYMKPLKPAVSSPISLPMNRVRATFTVSAAEIQMLKNLALTKMPAMGNKISSLVILSGHIWSCLAKSAAAVGEGVEDNEAEYITCTANCRAMMSPPLPSTYFGNCTVLLLGGLTHGTLRSGKEGFVAAANTIGEAIHEIKNKRDNAFDDLETRMKLKGKRVLTIAGSPRYELYGVDHGWGKPLKFEYLSNDYDGSVFLCMAKLQGRIEICMSLPYLKMDAFAAFFREGISEAAETLHLISSL